MRTTLLLLSALLLSGCGSLHHSWHWKEADLDRNRFDLGLARGAHDARTLAGWVRQGRVVEATGIGPTTHHEKACYLFTTPDGHDVSFRKVGC